MPTYVHANLYVDDQLCWQLISRLAHLMHAAQAEAPLGEYDAATSSGVDEFLVERKARFELGAAGLAQRNDVQFAGEWKQGSVQLWKAPRRAAVCN